MIGSEAKAVNKLCFLVVGVDHFLLVPPQDIDRTAITLRTLECAKEAKVKHILFHSIFMAERDDWVFGKQYKPIEERIKEMGIPYTIVSPLLLLLRYVHRQNNF